LPHRFGALVFFAISRCFRHTFASSTNIFWLPHSCQTFTIFILLRITIGVFCEEEENLEEQKTKTQKSYRKMYTKKNSESNMT